MEFRFLQRSCARDESAWAVGQDGFELRLAFASRIMTPSSFHHCPVLQSFRF